MRKIYQPILGLALLLMGFNSIAQVSAYSFNQSSGAYSAITGGTVYGDATSDDEKFTDPAIPLGGFATTDVGLPIGFNFTYNSTVYDVFAISNNGYIAFGQSALAPAAIDIDVNGSDYEILSTTSGAMPIHQDRVAGLNRDLQAQAGSELRVQLLGVAPSRTLVVQWKNYRRYNHTGDNLNYQIRLTETSNVVELVYGTVVVSGPWDFHIGLRGDSETDFNDREVLYSNTWATSHAGLLNTSVANIAPSLLPVSGQSYKWTPATSCSGTPGAGIVSPSATVCVNANAIISNTNTNTFTGIAYQWQEAPTSTGPWTNVTTGSGYNTAVLTTDPITTLTFYHLVITCTNSAQSVTTSVTSVNPNSPPTLCYCTSFLGGGNCNGDNISNVSILSTSLNNNSGCSNTSNGDSYSQFNPTGAATTTLNAASSYTISVNTTASNIVGLWIDYDHSGTFDQNEYNQVSAASSANVASTLIFYVPGNALAGVTGMRVRTVSIFSSMFDVDACTQFFDGETEDYFVTINAAAACSGVPAPGSIIATPTLVCSGDNVNMTLVGTTAASGLTFQWQESTNSTGPWTAITNATTTALSQAVFAPTYYRVIVACGTNTAASAFVFINTQLPALCYCVSGLGGGGCNGNNISNVSILTTPLNNNSGCSNTSSLDSYSQFSQSANTTATLNAAASYSISVNTTQSNNISFWIDYDHSGTFDPIEFSQVTTTSTANVPSVLLFNIPATALGGVTGMRVRSHDAFATVLDIDACTNFYEGETEDYLVTITPAPPCSGVPNPGSIVASPTLVCSGTQVNMIVSGFSASSGLSFQWQQSANSTGPWTSVTGATATAFSTPITSAGYFHVIVACGTNTAVTSPIQFSLQPSYACYCNQNLGGSGCFGDNITNVTILGTPLNNNSGCNNTSLNGTYTQFAMGPTTTATLAQGIPYTISVKTTANNIESVWIDYDHSGTFDASEHTQICLTSTPNVASTAIINIPSTSLLGLTGMRVRSRAQGNFNGPTDACTSFGSGEAEDYIVTIVAPTPCSGAPASNTIIASTNSICPNSSVNLYIANTYTTSGITYQWSSSTVSTGPYTAVNGGTLSTLSTPNLTTTTWYQIVATCSVGPASTTVSPLSVVVQSVTINSVPYNEGFEGISTNNQLPNCSWSASNLPIICQTYTGTPPPTVYNRVPHSGSKFASFRWGTNTSGDYFYSNGIQLTAGVTYSASAYYITDGFNGWSEFSLLYGTNQTSTGLTNIASATGALTNTTYSLVSNIFVAPTTGVYYIAVKCKGTSSPEYLTWDDLSVIALPTCSGAPASNTVVASTASVCTGGSVTLSLATTYTNGGLTYQWSSSPNLAGPYTAVSGATASVYSNTNVTTALYYRAVITCVSGPASTTATPVQVGLTGPAIVYATVPYLENFDNTWQNHCDINNVPVSASWYSNPTTGNNSWRRQDDGASANWTLPTSNTVAPLTGAGCANFHTYYAPYLTSGDLNLYVNMGTTSPYKVQFWYENLAGDDSLQVFLSTNGGNTFTYKATYLVDPTWAQKTIYLPAVNSPSCVLKFRATSDYGYDDIGIDSLKIVTYTCAPVSVSLTASQATICNGSSTNLTGSGATSYTWSTGANTSSISVTPSVTTSYTLSGENVPGCPGTKSITINVNTGPTVAVTASPGFTICPGGSAVLTATSSSSNFTWTPGNFNTAAITVTPASSAVYNVASTNSLGCITNTNVTVFVVVCTGVAKNTVVDNSTFIYPNPNSGNINVIIENSNGSYAFDIHDLSGRLVYSTTLTASESAISIKELANGLYTYRVTSLTTNVAIKEGKLIKE